VVTATGDLKDLVFWWQELLQPEHFRQINSLKMLPEDDSSGVLRCSVEIWQWYRLSPDPRRQLIHCSLALILLSSRTVAMGAGDGAFEPPQALPSERYSPIWERTPFALKVTQGLIVASRSFAENFALAGLSRRRRADHGLPERQGFWRYVKLTNQVASDSGIAFERDCGRSRSAAGQGYPAEGSETATVGYSQEPAGGVPAGGGGPLPVQAGALGKKPAGPPGGPPPPGGSDGPGGDPNAQQKSRRRIILPQAGAPQSSISVPPVTRNLLVSWMPLGVSA